MKNPFSFLSLSKFRENTAIAFMRFPVAIALSVGIAVMFFTILHGNLDTWTESIMYRMILSGVATFFLSVGVSLHGESHATSRLQGYLLQTFPAVFGVLFYFGFSPNLDNERNVVFFLLTFVGIVAYLFFAPFIKKLFAKNSTQETYYTFFYTIATVFLISFILWGVLAFLGNIAIWSVMSLFDLQDVLTDKAYGDWMIIALSLLAPFFALTKLPTRETFESGQYHENAFFSFLVKYIAIPFIHVYFVILYAYSVKVLMNFSEWPKGEVSWMVIGFSLFGYLLYIFSYIFEWENRFIRFFRKGFPMAVLPQLAMLGYAIYLRINQYDLTMNRYFVVVFGIWLLVISLYLLVSSRKYLAFIPAILTLFTILVSIGPWSVYHLPMDRQMKRLEKNMIQAHILQDGKIVPLKTAWDISRDLSKEIYEGIDYICGFDDCIRIKERFAEQYKKIEADSRAEFEQNKEQEIKNATTEEAKKYALKQTYTGPYKWEIVRKLAEILKVETYYGDKYEETPMISFSQMNDVRVFPLDIHGYAKIYQIDSYYKAGVTSIKQIVSYNQDAQSLEILENNKVIDTISVGDYFKKMVEKYSTSRETQLPSSDMILVSGKYKVIFEGMTVKNPKFTGDKKMQYGEYVNGYVLVK